MQRDIIGPNYIRLLNMRGMNMGRGTILFFYSCESYKMIYVYKMLFLCCSILIANTRVYSSVRSLLPDYLTEPYRIKTFSLIFRSASATRRGRKSWETKSILPAGRAAKLTSRVIRQVYNGMCVRRTMINTYRLECGFFDAFVNITNISARAHVTR